MPQIGDEVQVVYRDPETSTNPLTPVGVAEITRQVAYGRLAAYQDETGHVAGIAVESDGGVLILMATELISVERIA